MGHREDSVQKKVRRQTFKSPERVTSENQRPHSREGTESRGDSATSSRSERGTQPRKKVMWRFDSSLPGSAGECEKRERGTANLCRQKSRDCKKKKRSRIRQGAALPWGGRFFERYVGGQERNPAEDKKRGKQKRNRQKGRELGKKYAEREPTT